MVTCESLSQTGSAEFWSFHCCQQTVEQAAMFPKIWDQSWQALALVNGGFLSKKASIVEVWFFVVVFLLVWISCWANSQVAEDFRSKLTIIDPLWGEFSHTKSHWWGNIHCRWAKQTVEQAVELSVIWNVMTKKRYYSILYQCLC